MDVSQGIQILTAEERRKRKGSCSCVWPESAMVPCGEPGLLASCLIENNFLACIAARRQCSIMYIHAPLATCRLSPSLLSSLPHAPCRCGASVVAWGPRAASCAFGFICLLVYMYFFNRIAMQSCFTRRFLHDNEFYK